MKLKLSDNIVSSLYHITGKIEKHSPEILMATGIISAIAGTVLACKATLKSKDIVEEVNEKMDELHSNDLENNETTEDRNKKITSLYVKTSLKVVKEYSPAIILGAVSITSILSSNNILNKRSSAVAAAYATVDKAFKSYRKNVVDEFGEQKDYELKHGIKKEKIKETVVDENGKKKTVTKEIEVVDDAEHSAYARFFDELSMYYQKDAESNLMFLRQQERWANDKLQLEGRIFLNDVYDMLGIPKTKAGQVIGWVFDPDHPNDHYVDFGIYNVHKSGSRQFVNGYERAILLDFNVDGNVWETM